MKKALSIVCSTILLLALLVIPTQAAQSVSVTLPVSQTVTLEGEGAKAEDAVVNYVLTAVTADAPMPEGTQDGSYFFELNGEQTYLDTVYYEHNELFSYYDAFINREDSSYTMIAPSNTGKPSPK